MKQLPFTSLRARIMLLVVLVLVPAFGLVLYGDAEQRRLATQEAQDKALRLARLAAADQTQLTQSAHQFLSTLALFPEVRSHTAAACNDLFANLLKQNPAYANLGIADLNGDVYCSARPSKNPVNLADHDYFQTALKSQDLAIGEYHVDEISGLATLDLGLPILDDRGAPQAVIFASLNLTWVNQFAAQTQLPPGSVVDVIDRNQIILAHSPDPAAWVGKSIQAAPILQAIAARQDEGTTEAAGADGVMRLYAFVPLRQAGKTPNAEVIVGIPSAVAYADVNQGLLRNLVALGVVAVLALAAAWFVGDIFIVRRVTALASATKQFAAGNLSARTRQPYAAGELGDLARRLDEMAAALQQRQSMLGRWRDIFQNTQVGLRVSSQDGTLLLMNPAFASMHGYNVDALVGRPLDDLVTPDSRAGLQEQIRRLNETGHHIFEAMSQRSDGAVFPTLVDATAVKDNEGNVLYHIAMVQDIGELRRAEEAEREQRVLAEAMRDVAAALNSTLDFEKVLDRILENVGRVVPHDAANIMLVENGSARVVRSKGYAERGADWLAARRLALAEIPRLRLIVDSGQPNLVANTQNASNWVGLPETRWIRSAIGMPIRSHEGVIGILNLDSAIPGFFNAAHVSRSHAFADQVAIAIENARLLAETEKRAGQFSALYDIARALGSQRDLAALLQMVVDRAIGLLNSPCGFIYLYDAAQNDLVLTVEKGIDSPVGLRLQMGEGMAGRVAQSRQPLIVDDYRTWESRSAQYAGAAYTAVVEVPMVHGGELIGVLGVSEIETTLRKFTEADAYLLTLFAGQAASMVRDARLLEQARTRTEQLALLYDAGLALNSVLDPRIQLQFLFTIARQALSAERAEFFRFDAKRNALDLELQVGFSEEIARAASARLRFSIADERAIVSWVGRKHVPLRIGDVQADPRWIVVDPEIRSALWAPIQHENQLRGVLSVLSTRLNAFTPQDERLVVLFANQAAVAMENARLFNESQSSLEVTTRLYQLSGQTLTATTLEETAQLITETLRDAFGCDAAAIAFFDGAGELEFKSDVGFQTELNSDAQVRPDAMALQVWKSGQPVIINDPALLAPRLRAEGIVSCIGLPLRGETIHLGVMSLSYRRPHAFSDRDVQLLNLVANQAALALKRVRLLEETHRRADRLAVLTRIASAISQTMDLDELLEVIYQEVSATFTQDAFFIALYDEKKNELDYRVQIDQGIREPPSRRSLTSGFGAQVITTQKPLLIRDWEKEKDHLPHPVLWGTMKPPLSWLGVPMRIGNTVVGIIGVEAYSPNAYGEEEEHLLVTLADQVAVVIQNVRLYDETRQRLSELEAVNKISTALRAARSVDDMTRVLLDEMLGVFGTTTGQVAFYDATTQEMRVAVARGWFVDTPRTAKSDDGIAGLVFRTGQPYVTREFKPDPNTSELARPYIPEGWGGAIVPVRTAQEIIGVLGVSVALPRELRADEIRLLNTLAEIAGNAFHRAALNA
ncbi:MAG: GAF domain-containing protein [Chloroflexota bacterium]|nr:GAF domain-containing protein [Chloroflexota bacterium]